MSLQFVVKDRDEILVPYHIILVVDYDVACGQIESLGPVGAAGPFLFFIAVKYEPGIILVSVEDLPSLFIRSIIDNNDLKLQSFWDLGCKYGLDRVTNKVRSIE